MEIRQVTLPELGIVIYVPEKVNIVCIAHKENGVFLGSVVDTAEGSEEKGIGVSYPAQHLIHELKVLPEPVRKTVAMNLVRKIAEVSGLGFGTIKVGR